MKCINCGNKINFSQRYSTAKCPVCGQPLPRRKHKTLPQVLIGVLIWLVCIVIFSLLCYKGYYWLSEYNLVRQYTRGALTPTFTGITMSDGRTGHALIFYGNDGDQIFLPELGYSTMIAGGTARFEFADSDWFEGMNVAEIDGADIVFSPILLSQTGEQTRLPTQNLYIAVPESPFTVTSPNKEGVSIFTSSYNLAGWVVPGSIVSINGEDVTSYVDRAGNISLNVRVQPINNNVYTFLVKTANHRETRYDITIYRQKLPIEIELDSTVSTRSSNSTMTISGKAEPGSIISVDTVHLEDSVSFNMETGEFSFIVQFESIGNNLVRFRAAKDGRENAVISFNVYYVPSRANYVSRAWKMDYSQLRLLFEQWQGRIFRCDGTLVDKFTENNTEYWVMDIGTSEQQLILLTNDSNTKDPALGRKYTAYADVQGRHMYNASYYPVLTARYMDIYTN